MTDPGLARFLELVVRELSAADARVELGGRDPVDPRLVFRPVPGGRVVAVFDEPPLTRAILEARLDSILGSFPGTAEGVLSLVPPSRTPPDLAGRRLDDELGRLAERAGAVGALVFDLASPVVWGASATSDPRVDALLDDVISAVRSARSELRPGHSSRLPVKPGAPDGFEVIARPFAGLYVVAAVFQGAVSEPQALGALLHAMPIIERLVLALPPVDPPPGGAKVVRMPARLR
jgi:hypothetical protein